MKLKTFPLGSPRTRAGIGEIRQVLTLMIAALVLLLAASVNAQQAPAAATTGKAANSKTAGGKTAPDLEPKAIDILKTACHRLAAAHSMSFTAIVAYESPSLLGPPLAYMTKSQILMERPDKLRVFTLADGPRSDFYYNGKTMMAFEPAENLVAIAPAPPTIDGALKAAYDKAAIYFPFSDVVVADPYKDLSEGLKVAFYIGQSNVVGGITTDMVAYANDAVFVQIWIGHEDKLPRMLRAVFRNDQTRLRHGMELTNWQLDPVIQPGAFTSSKAEGAKRIVFARPDPWMPSRFAPPPKKKPAKTQ